MNTEQQIEEINSRKVNKIVTSVLLIVVIIVSGIYIYFALPAFFDDEMPPIPYPEPSAPLNEEQKQQIVQSVVDPVENDEGGMLKVLKSIPKATGVKKLSEQEMNSILEGN